MKVKSQSPITLVKVKVSGLHMGENASERFLKYIFSVSKEYIHEEKLFLHYVTPTIILDKITKVEIANKCISFEL